jgi:hypothetical protein
MPDDDDDDSDDSDDDNDDGDDDDDDYHDCDHVIFRLSCLAALVLDFGGQAVTLCEQVGENVLNTT